MHTPEYAFEHVASNVAAGAKRLHISYPVALDNAYATWSNFGIQSWPADYLIDPNGQVRHATIGEGDYGGTETLIRQLLSAATPGVVLPPGADVPDTTPTDTNQTQETYLGSQRANSNANTADGTLTSGRRTFSYPPSVPTNLFAPAGTWTVGTQSLVASARAAIKLNYNADDVYLDVGGTGSITATVGGKTSTYHVAGAPNIYTLVHTATARQGLLTMSLSAGLIVYSFTFG